MALYKYDIHVHTKEVSSCGKVPAIEVVKLYKDAGYHGIVITDHYFASFFINLDNLTWDEKIDCYLKGYNKAFEIGKKIGLKVILGMELRFIENANDYLVYGFDEKFLRNNKELYNLNLKEFRELTKDQDIIIFQAHPFRAGMIPAPPELLDGIEIHNGNPRHNSHNDLAYKYALENQLLMLSGSDFHQKGDVAGGGIIITDNIDDSRGFADIIRSNKIIELIK